MKRMIAFVILLGLLAVMTALPVSAAHLPTPNFDHEGQDVRCQSTNPHNIPAKGIPADVFAQQHGLWHSECDAVENNGHVEG